MHADSVQSQLVSVLFSFALIASSCSILRNLRIAFFLTIQNENSSSLSQIIINYSEIVDLNQMHHVKPLVSWLRRYVASRHISKPPLSPLTKLYPFVNRLIQSFNQRAPDDHLAHVEELCVKAVISSKVVTEVLTFQLRCVYVLKYTN